MGDRPATGRRPRGRRRAWAVLVSLVAALMAPVLVAPAALAVEVPPSVREIADRLLNGPVPDGRTDEGEPCYNMNQGGTVRCVPMDAGTAPLGTLPRLAPGIAAGLARNGVVQGFKNFGAGCSANRSACLSLGLATIAALLGIGMGAQEVLELVREDNPDYEPPPTLGDFPEGQWSTPNGGDSLRNMTITPTALTDAGGSLTLVFQLEMTGWNECIGGTCGTSGYSTVFYQCRDLGSGNAAAVKSLYIGTSWTGSYTYPSTAPFGAGKTLTQATDCAAAYNELIYVSMSPNPSGNTGPQLLWHWGAEQAVGSSPPPAGDPDLDLDTATGGGRLECRDSMGSSYFVDVSAPAGTLDVPMPRCLDGDLPVGLEVGTVAPGGGLSVDTAYDLSPEALRPAATGPYPQCAGAACLYVVKVDGKVCGVGDAECVRWTQNPAAQCWYGPYQVDRSACYLLERSYEVQSPSVPATRPNTDGDPTTSSPPAVEELPAPGTTRPTECRSAYFALGAVQPALVSAVDAVYEANQSAISNVYGYRPSDPFPDHPSGIAADFMVRSTAGGHAVANHILANASAYNVKYVLWNQQSWNPSRGTWEPMADRGSDTANHKDHVHLTVNVTDGANACGASPQPTSGEDVDRMNDACFPSGVAAFNPLEWVLRPTKCALAWAFIPGVTFTDGSMSYNVGNYLTEWLEGSRTPFDNSPLGGWKAFLGGVGGSFSAVGASVSCEGPAVPTAMLGEAGVLPDVIYPFRACEGVMATAAATSRMVLTGIIAWGTLWRVTRIIGAPFGYNLEAIGRSGRVS